LTVATLNAAAAPHLRDYLAAHGVTLRDFSGDEQAARDAVSHHDEKLVLQIPADHGQRWAQGEPAPVVLFTDKSNTDDGRQVERVRDLLQNYARDISGQRLLLRGIDPVLLSPQPIHEIDVSTPTSRSVLILGMLDFFLILAMMSGGIYLAIDITAGERERGTLEPLLTLPVTRDALLIGKLLTTCAYMALSLSLTTAGFFIAMSRIGLESLGMSARLDPWAAVAVIAVALPLVPVGAGLLTLVASFTRSVREAQAWVGVVQLLPTLPLVFVTMANLAPRTALMAVPSLSQHFLILKLLRAEDIAPLDVALSAGCSLVLGGLLMAAAARIYRRDSLLS
jgi:sodium transport system permease protein